MTDNDPKLFFRVRDSGALVFRLSEETSQRRLEMEPIASVNLRNGEIRAHGDKMLDQATQVRIRAWMSARQVQLAAREADEMQRVVEQLNMTAHWASSKATDAQLEAITDDLLMAMHDLRSVLLRRRADQITKARPNAA